MLGINGGGYFCARLKAPKKVAINDFILSLEIFHFVTIVYCYLNVFIAYRILLLIVPVTVASTERHFSKLKLLNFFLMITMLRERLNGLAMYNIEKYILNNIDLDTILNDFASRNAPKSFFVTD